jgi:ketosteroid isomerase-like protein
MSQENVEMVRAMYDAFHRGDAAAAVRCLDAAVVLDASHRVDGRVGRGLDEVAAIVAEWMEPWEGWRQEIEEIHDLGDRVLVIATQSGRGRGSGVEWSNRFGMLYEIAGAKVTHWTVYDDVRLAREAAGLSA